MKRGVGKSEKGEQAVYGDRKPPEIYYENAEYALTLMKGDCIDILNNFFGENTFDMIFADPPYFLSNGGITCHAGRMVSVNKGGWDKSRGVDENHSFNMEWLKACRRVLKPNGTIWVSGTTHVIYSIGFALQRLGYRILNDIVWYKPNAPPNLSCRYFTHSTEIVLWAAKSEKSKHHFDYPLMKEMNRGKQMRNLWEIRPPAASEKHFGKHITQKPLELLKRVILASTEKGNLVLDPFCGSSSTGVACVLTGRRYVGIDLEENYLELSRKRLEEAESRMIKA
ncbi:MAG TPA: site-specific DNA-methyltransferase [Syntrophales bacterium]|nr:site-specific DNA-methyltransferase [Syntrophales bacterium]HOX93842.1 site-specific DNA-methyltransferase [Syntrophales bacterium]HPI57010.1 site-specific DNA-methyltransferase [Syntrophales bacterium]HPN23860.1 site-specific DNA-methyltransferase [Syntrophales bacterium]HQM29997.1 site-specific DNA-methyltransferase [Syntrophales bacterium]